jgi:D-arabinose 1-dehydrogenase-like Zn-dependent alcohol dehydrogenase
VKDLGKDPDDLTMAIQGFGNVGSWAARLAKADGYNVVGGFHGWSLAELFVLNGYRRRSA